MNPLRAAALKQYEALAVSWDANLGNARIANQIYDRMRHLSRELRQTAEGRQGIEQLLSHPNRGVRLEAAFVCLEWTPALAIPVLQDLVIPRGTQSLAAEMTLSEYSAGRLEFD